MWSIIREYRAVLDWNYCGVCVRSGRTVHTHTHTHTTQVQNYAAKHRPSTRQNICESLRVIPVKHSSVLPDDGSHKIRNMSEWFLIFCLLNFYTSWILTSKFCITECISRTIKVIDYNNARWKPEIKWTICPNQIKHKFNSSCNITHFLLFRIL
jgi:hypothetical protein